MPDRGNVGGDTAGVPRCLWCAEPGELLDGRHRECGVRMVVGSEACVRRRCVRMGGPGCGDDPRLSVRDAARAACAAYEREMRLRGTPDA